MTTSSDKFRDKLHEAVDTFCERNKIYKDGWVSHGGAMAALFPNGIQLKTPEDFSRFILFEMCVSKLNRYAQNFSDGGHPDSVHDNGVYSFILEIYDEQIEEEKEENKWNNS